jgi:hypothetical protein
MLLEPLGSEAATRPAVVHVETYHARRIAMSFGVLGSKLPGCASSIRGCVAKTTRGLARLGALQAVASSIGQRPPFDDHWRGSTKAAGANCSSSPRR